MRELLLCPLRICEMCFRIFGWLMLRIVLNKKYTLVHSYLAPVWLLMHLLWISCVLWYLWGAVLGPADLRALTSSQNLENLHINKVEFYIVESAWNCLCGSYTNYHSAGWHNTVLSKVDYSHNQVFFSFLALRPMQNLSLIELPLNIAQSCPHLAVIFLLYKGTK